MPRGIDDGKKEARSSLGGGSRDGDGRDDVRGRIVTKKKRRNGGRGRRRRGRGGGLAFACAGGMTVRALVAAAASSVASASSPTGRVAFGAGVFCRQRRGGFSIAAASAPPLGGMSATVARPAAAAIGRWSGAAAAAIAGRLHSDRHVSVLLSEVSRRWHRHPTSGAFAALSASSASDSADDGGSGEYPLKERQNESSPPKKRKKRGKFRVNPNAEMDFDADALTAEFDRLAMREGFEPSTARFADGATFEDDFDYDDLSKERGQLGIVGDWDAEGGLDLDDDEDDDLEGGWYDDDDDGDDFLDLEDDVGGLGRAFETSANAEGRGEDDRASRAAAMADRIAAARTDLDRGRITASDELDSLSREVTEADLHKLGFKREANPFGDDETPRREAFKLVSDALVCGACGADFQSRSESKPGYLPREKYEVQLKLSKIEEMQRLQEKAESFEWSPEDEIEWLIQSQGGDEPGGRGGEAAAEMAKGGIDVHAMANEMGLDLTTLSEKKVICRRCHRLQNFGDVDERLRPGWTEEPLLSQESFRDLLQPIRDRTAVVVALVDLFDFAGSVLPELDSIAGDNPVILAANKADLLPSKMGKTRAESWVRRELEHLGVKSIGNIGGAIRLVSCKTGFGLRSLLGKVRSLAEEMECDVYVVGAANAGKSTLINFILDKNDEKKLAYKFGKKKLKKRAGNANARKGAVTTSPLPGTTLKFIKVDLGNGVDLYDTPGLLVPGTLTQRLTPAELKMVVPRKEVEPITFRVASDKCVLVGGLARIEVIGGSKPFLFTFFVGNDIKLHPTDVTTADEFVAKHAGGMLTPPLKPGPERMAEIGEFESHDIDIEGAGWKEAAADITLRGLGWVSVTGAGTAKVRVSVPKGIGISVRPPLMPFDIWEATARYTGGRAVRKGGKTKAGKTRKGVGRR